MIEHPTNPTIFPTFALIDQIANRMPRFPFPNQFAIAVIIPGQPTPWKNPFNPIIKAISTLLRLWEIAYEKAIDENASDAKIIPTPMNIFRGTLLIKEDSTARPSE